MLGNQDRSVLDFERSWIVMKGPKDREIEAVLGLTSAAYYERLRELTLTPDARAYDPLTIKRIEMQINHRFPMEAFG